MITNCGKFFPLVRDKSAVLGLYLVRGGSFGVEPSGDDDAVTINVMLEGFLATILESDGDFRGSEVHE